MSKNYTSAEQFDAIQELIALGFDLDRNSARDLLSCAVELLDHKEEEQKKSVQVIYTGGGFWISVKYISKHIYAVVNNEYEDELGFFDDREDIKEDQEFGCFDLVRSVTMDDPDCKSKDRKLYKELHDALIEQMNKCEW